MAGPSVSELTRQYQDALEYRRVVRERCCDEPGESSSAEAQAADEALEDARRELAWALVRTALEDAGPVRSGFAGALTSLLRRMQARRARRR
jgi:hypothetical protein